MSTADVSRDQIATDYLSQLPYTPYRVQEEAILAWFTSNEGVMVCAPTGMGKTLIAEAALYETLRTGGIAYYTTPLIALTEQKFREMQTAAVQWGFSANDVGLVTGNRRVNPDARILVVVAEILLNRLLHPAAFDFVDVRAVVMDEFHSFNDPERGAVWELTLALLPKHVRLLLLSATVGNAVDFSLWLYRSHGRNLELIQSSERRVPLSFQWVGDQMLDELLEQMADGEEQDRRVPALVFCFNRMECWSVAELLKGRSLLAEGQQKKLTQALAQHNLSLGAGPKLKQILLRGVGVHHAGIIPRYRRIVEQLFQRKLLSVCLCTETLAAGINLPARSVVITTLLKGPPGKRKLIDGSTAHQIFGRAGRPQFDSQGFVYSIAHEDDVRFVRWKEQYDYIPEDTRDPALIRAKKLLKKKMPQRRKNEQYWNEAQFEKLKTSPPLKLASRGQLPWRLLGYLLKASPDVSRLRQFAGKRLLDAQQLELAQVRLNEQLLSLWAGGYVTLSPTPPSAPEASTISADNSTTINTDLPVAGMTRYEPELAVPTEALDQLLVFRSVNPLYGQFLTKFFETADWNERILMLESLMEVPRSMISQVRAPGPKRMPFGPLATERLHPELLSRGICTQDDILPPEPEERVDPSERRWPLHLAEKLYLLFQADFPSVEEIRISPVWIVGDLLSNFHGNFQKYVSARDLTKQEGLVFRHLLRFILVLDEFQQLVPAGIEQNVWLEELRDLATRLTQSCREVDSESTEHMLEQSHAADIVLGETAAKAQAVVEPETIEPEEVFGEGLWDEAL